MPQETLSSSHGIATLPLNRNSSSGRLALTQYYAAVTMIDEQIGWRSEVIAEYGNARMIRRGRYKLIRRFQRPNGTFPDQLYDRAKDPRETVNVIQSCEGSVLDELDGRLDNFFEVYSRPQADGRLAGNRRME